MALYNFENLSTLKKPMQINITMKYTHLSKQYSKPSELESLSELVQSVQGTWNNSNMENKIKNHNELLLFQNTVKMIDYDYLMVICVFHNGLKN